MYNKFDFESGLTGMNFGMGDTTPMDFGGYADFASMTDGSGSNLFSSQLDGFQPTWGQRFMTGLNDLGQAGASNMGALNAGLSAITGLANVYNGRKQMGLFERQLNQQRDQWERNYAAQVNDVNERREDRQRMRVAANPNAESVSSYMNRWSLK